MVPDISILLQQLNKISNHQGTLSNVNKPDVHVSFNSQCNDSSTNHRYQCNKNGPLELSQKEKIVNIIKFVAIRIKTE